jgi:hypothetical protein
MIAMRIQIKAPRLITDDNDALEQAVARLGVRACIKTITKQPLHRKQVGEILGTHATGFREHILATGPDWFRTFAALDESPRGQQWAERLATENGGHGDGKGQS